MSSTALTNVRLFTGAGLSERTTVVIDGAVLGGDPAGATEIDGNGATVLPGLTDAHLHLMSPDDLDKLARHGITTALDMACWPRQRVDSYRGRVPDIRSAGLPAIGPGGPHSHLPGMPESAILTDPGQAEGFVAARVAEGSDYIKIVVDRDLLSQEIIDAVVAAAKAQGMRTVAHATSVDAYRRAVRAGADVLTHAPRDGVLDAETAATMAAHGQVAVPTLVMMKAVTDARPIPGESYAHSRESVAVLHAAGVPVLAGTDAFSGPGPIPNPVEHGVSLPEELALLVGAGLTEVEALRAATVLPARHFGLTDRGALTPGLRADLLVVDGDPTRDIGAVTKIRHVFAAGIDVTPS